MRICYVGHFDTTGYGQASIGYLEALEKNGCEVVAVPFKLNNTKLHLTDTLKKCINRKMSGVELILLHTLPSFFDKHSSLPTIGIFSTEMSGIPKNWVDNINYLARNIVSSDQSHDCCKASGVTNPLHIIPYCFDLEKLNNCGILEIIENLKKDKKKIFYTVGEFINRKNFSAILRAYYSAFSKKDNVHLIIKSNMGGKTPAELSNIFQIKNNEIVKGLNLNPQDLPEITFIPEYLSEYEMNSLHNSCDIYISASYGESFDLSAFTAMAFGKTLIVPDYYVYLKYMNRDIGFLVKSYESPCFGLVDADPSLYNSHFNFFQIDILDLKNTMIRVYKERSEVLHLMSDAGIEKSKEFSYDSIGPIFREVLESAKKEQTDSPMGRV